MQQPLSWLWLAWVLGAGAKTAEVLRLYPTAQELFEAVGREDMRGLFTAAQQKRLTQGRPEDFAPVWAECQRLGVQVITWQDEAYPPQMRRIEDAPLVLYCTGNPQALQQECMVALIGSRRPSQYGVEAARALSTQLAQQQVCLVSGLADGLDSEAHKASVEANAPTVAVLGTPIDRTYPASNRTLRRKVEQVGAVISEYAPGSSTSARHFLQRNRLIAALSHGVCVVEAREKSGTMNTVHHAQRYDRPVFAVPGAIFSPLCEGTNRLLEDGLAKAVSSGNAILKGLGRRASCSVETTPAKEEPAFPLSPQAQQMAKVLTAKPQSLDALVAATGLAAGDALAALLELELSGLAQSGAGGQYRSR